MVARTEQEGGRLPGTIHGTVDQIKEAGGSAVAVKCDVTKDEEVQALAQAVRDQFGRLDVLVNNAGIRVNVPLLDLEFRHWDLTMRVNMHGPFLGCKHLAPIMVEQGRGSIINVTSSAAQNIRPRGVSYSVSKAALDVFTIGLSKELEGERHRCQRSESRPDKDGRRRLHLPDGLRLDRLVSAGSAGAAFNMAGPSDGQEFHRPGRPQGRFRQDVGSVLTRYANA